MRLPWLSWLLLLMWALACSPSKVGQPQPVGPDNHRWFPIGVGTGHAFGKVTTEGAIGCESCHRSGAESFAQVRCDHCHQHPQALTERLHLGVANFGLDAGSTTDLDELAELRGATCYGCHPNGEPQPFSHTGIYDQCAECHAETTAFAALPKAGFTHRAIDGLDCGGCHVTESWALANGAPPSVADPLQTLTVTGLVPTFAGTTITQLTPLIQQLKTPMNHSATAVDAGILSNCSACHASASAGAYYPGNFHSSLANLGAPAPVRCSECHAVTQPIGFVGAQATSPVRTPPSGEMRHEAVVWVDGGVSTSRLVSHDCSVCHRSPDDQVASKWSTPLGEDGGPPRFHAGLVAGSQPQPSSCLDCHANSRPVVTLTSANSAMPAGLAYDHTVAEALGDCTPCHVSTEQWQGGKMHQSQPSAPSTCLPCHQQERPTSTAGWVSATYAQRPFDYVTNARGVTHGGGEDCVTCHQNTQTWVGGHFAHGAGTLAASTCIACHLSQRPTALVSGFDHSLNGAGDCRGCHQATVRAGRYVDYFNPTTGMLPGGDWKDGQTYPGDVLATSATQFVTLSMFFLQRNVAGLVTGMTGQSVSLPNGMLHTSSVIPAQVNPGPAATPNNASCWHCHTHDASGVVTAFKDGKYHSALTGYSATPGGAVTPLAQPTTGCKDCHEHMRPNAIVERASSPLRAMDHSARFVSAVNIGGQSASAVADLDCSACHATPGTSWADGRFHVSIGAAVPTDCVGCHYPLMATATADVSSSTDYTMKHQYAGLASQKCDVCHSTAFAQSQTTPVAATLWRMGQLHASISTQPSTCIDCHSGSDPAQPSQSSVVYTLTAGGTASNGAQWMNHAVAEVTSRDCVVCHSADAKSSGSAWSKGTAFHQKIGSPAACNVCHGVQNGLSAAPGTSNNIPSGNVASRHVTSASPWPGVKDEINHADLNVTSHDCDFCHTQLGPSTAPAVQGQEWKQATFHQNFTAANPLVMNTTSARCSTCHLNLKPPASFSFDHSSFTNASGSPDCSSCHSWPGTSAASPNWLGAAAMPTFIAVGGFKIPQPPAKTANLIQPGIANLPHPTVTKGVLCTSCHALASGGRHATGYPHTSALISSQCNACHEAGTDLLGTVWNGSTAVSGGAGDSRPFTLTGVTPSFKGNSRACNLPNHFYPVDCKECHQVPTGNGAVTTGAAYLTAWRFKHSEGSPMTKPSTCNLCHAATGSGGCGIPK